MKKLSVTILLVFLISNLYSVNLPEQTPWKVLNIRGHSVDPQTGKIDDTEGFGAFDSIIKQFDPECPNNFDNGGGAFDDTSNYIKEKYNINNVVFDPFMRSDDHNEKVLKDAQLKPYDCCTSISVLNVIDNQQARLAHIAMCHTVLKENGQAFFKIWPGNNTGIEHKTQNSYQSNKNAFYYINEVKKVFGDNNAILVDEKTIRAIKRTT